GCGGGSTPRYGSGCPERQSKGKRQDPPYDVEGHGPRAGDAALVLPVELDPRRSAAGPRSARSIDQAGCTRSAGAADAGRSEVARARGQLREPVAHAAQSEEPHSEPG